MSKEKPDCPMKETNIPTRCFGCLWSDIHHKPNSLYLDVAGICNCPSSITTREQSREIVEEYLLKNPDNSMKGLKKFIEEKAEKK